MGTTTTSTAHPDHPLCVLPSCGNHVERWGQPCQDCRTAFGPRLRAAGRLARCAAAGPEGGEGTTRRGKERRRDKGERARE